MSRVLPCVAKSSYRISCGRMKSSEHLVCVQDFARRIGCDGCPPENQGNGYLAEPTTMSGGTSPAKACVLRSRLSIPEKRLFTCLLFSAIQRRRMVPRLACGKKREGAKESIKHKDSIKSFKSILHKQCKTITCMKAFFKKRSSAKISPKA